MKYEEKLLTYLVENYRKSKKDFGANKINRRTQVKPEKMYKKYRANDGDFEEIAELNRTVERLCEQGFITCDRENFGTQIQMIYLVDEKITDIEQYLTEKYGYVSKDAQMEQLSRLVDKYQNASSICGKECEILQECIENRRIPKNVEELEDILKAVAFIEKNQAPLYIREMSMKVYGDSKYFENVTLPSVCSLLRKYSDKRNTADGSLPDGMAESQHERLDEKPDEILLDYLIAKEPQKLCIKGKAIINISGKEVDISAFTEGIEFGTSDLENICSIQLLTSKFMTIENRTSYLRFRGDDVVTFYLGGYANRFQRDFLRMVHQQNPDVRYLHFGDIDAGGFWIHHNLCEVTGVEFDLFAMSVKELQSEEFASCLHELTEHDRTRLRELKEMEKYSEVVDYMLERNIKLEQEIVSLTYTASGL